MNIPVNGKPYTANWEKKMGTLSSFPDKATVVITAPHLGMASSVPTF
jgi:hypothetical protein